MEEITVRHFAGYLKEHDRILENGEEKSEGKEIVCEALKMLRAMPDSYVVLKGGFRLQNYEKDESELFYIPDMLLFMKLLKEDYPFQFIHECSDFLHYKILHDGKREMRYLPTDIKNALITAIEKGVSREA